MYRVVSAFVLSGLLSLVTAIAPAAAGDGYYNRSYRDYDDRSYTPSDWRMTRYERGYREGYERPYYRRYRENNELPYYRRYSHRSYYNGSSYVTSRYYESPRRYYGYDYSDQPRRFYSEGCYPQQFRLYDDGGGWVWGTRIACH